MAKYDCSVIIPQLGLSELTRSLVEQIRKHECDSHVEIIAVINDPDGQPAIRDCNNVHIREKNLSRSWNHGVECCSTDLIILLNNDVICTGKFTRELSSLIRDGRAFAGAGKRRERFIGGRKILEGWCIAFHRETWRKLNGFDETMELYFADTDFMWRGIQDGVEIKAAKLPLKHLGHKTAHNRKLRPDRHRRYIQDETRFREKHPRGET